MHMVVSYVHCCAITWMSGITAVDIWTMSGLVSNGVMTVWKRSMRRRLTPAVIRTIRYNYYYLKIYRAQVL